MMTFTDYDTQVLKAELREEYQREDDVKAYVWILRENPTVSLDDSLSIFEHFSEINLNADKELEFELMEVYSAFRK